MKKQQQQTNNKATNNNNNKQTNKTNKQTTKGQTEIQPAIGGWLFLAWMVFATTQKKAVQ